MKIRLGLVAVCLLCVAGRGVRAQAPAANPEEEFIKTHYAKYEYRIPMRDGVKLFVSVYTPDPGAFKDPGPYPFLMTRTPYSCGPYGEDKMPTRLGNFFMTADNLNSSSAARDFRETSVMLPSRCAPQLLKSL